VEFVTRCVALPSHEAPIDEFFKLAESAYDSPERQGKLLDAAQHLALDGARLTRMLDRGLLVLVAAWLRETRTRGRYDVALQSVNLLALIAPATLLASTRTSAILAELSALSKVSNAMARRGAAKLLQALERHAASEQLPSLEEGEIVDRDDESESGPPNDPSVAALLPPQPQVQTGLPPRQMALSASERVSEAMAQGANRDKLALLAAQLQSEGLTQLELFVLFAARLKQEGSRSPAGEALLHVLRLIFSDPWAQGSNAMFATQLQPSALPAEVRPTVALLFGPRPLEAARSAAPLPAQPARVESRVLPEEKPRSPPSPVATRSRSPARLQVKSEERVPLSSSAASTPAAEADKSAWTPPDAIRVLRVERFVDAGVPPRAIAAAKLALESLLRTRAGFRAVAFRNVYGRRCAFVEFDGPRTAQRARLFLDGLRLDELGEALRADMALAAEARWFPGNPTLPDGLESEVGTLAETDTTTAPSQSVAPSHALLPPPPPPPPLLAEEAYAQQRPSVPAPAAAAASSSSAATASFEQRELPSPAPRNEPVAFVRHQMTWEELARTTPAYCLVVGYVVHFGGEGRVGTAKAELRALLRALPGFEAAVSCWDRGSLLFVVDFDGLAHARAARDKLDGYLLESTRANVGAQFSAWSVAGFSAMQQSAQQTAFTRSLVVDDIADGTQSLHVAMEALREVETWLRALPGFVAHRAGYSRGELEVSATFVDAAACEAARRELLYRALKALPQRVCVFHDPTATSTSAAATAAVQPSSGLVAGPAAVPASATTSAPTASSASANAPPSSVLRLSMTIPHALGLEARLRSEVHRLADEAGRVDSVVFPLTSGGVFVALLDFDFADSAAEALRFLDGRKISFAGGRTLRAEFAPHALPDLIADLLRVPSSGSFSQFLVVDEICRVDASEEVVVRAQHELAALLAQASGLTSCQFSRGASGELTATAAFSSAGDAIKASLRYGFSLLLSSRCRARFRLVETGGAQRSA
jgi:hypothetical protein